MDTTAPGRLVMFPPAGVGSAMISLGIRFDTKDGRFALAMTEFYGGAAPVWDAVDLSNDRGSTLSLDARLTLEPDLLAPATRGNRRDYRPGELVDTDQGMGIAAAFGRFQGGYDSAGLVNVNTWKRMSAYQPRTIFGAWRLRIDTGQLDPLYWQPGLVTAARGAIQA